MTFDYKLGSAQKVAINVFDEVPKSQNIPMGVAVFEIDDVLGARGGTKAKRLRKGGQLFVHIRKSSGSGNFSFQFKGVKLVNVEGVFRKSDPFFEICRKDDRGSGPTWATVFRSDVVMDDLDPKWALSSIELSVLCGGNLDLPILVRVYDWEKSGKHELMGEFESSVNGLVAAAGNRPIRLRHGGRDMGHISVETAHCSIPQTAPVPTTQTTPSAPSTPSPPIEQFSNMVVAMPPPVPPTFVDYVSGGCQLNVSVAIDFTGSNGDPRKPGTLHYLHKDGQLNDYEKAISSILGILSKYDSDKQFPVLGFGAKYGGVVRHVFQCGAQAEASGVDGVLKAYRDTFKSGLIMSRPTVFTDVIKVAAKRAEDSLNNALQADKQAYSILLLVTDGCVADVQATAQCLVEVSGAPLSLVIVGVGNEDFSGMRFLDDMNKPGYRDMADFINFNAHSQNPAELTSATLQEIPRHVVEFFQGRGIEPKLEEFVDEAEIMVEEEEEEEIDLSLSLEEDEIVVNRGGFDYSTW